MARPRLIYLGLAVVTLATLAFEIVTTRVLSVITWYHLAFFVVSLAMLGMTAAALFVYLRPAEFDGERVKDAMARYAFRFGLSLPASHIALLLLRIPTDLGLDAMSVVTLAATAVLCALPFFFSGLVVVLGLTRVALPIGRLYAADLIGAGLGCLLALGLMAAVDPTTGVLLLGVAGIGAGLAFGRGFELRLGRWPAVAAAILLVGAVANGLLYPNLLLVDFVKGKPLARPILVDRWNSHSRVTARPPIAGAPDYWGAGSKAPSGTGATGAATATRVRQIPFRIDGGAFTVGTEFDGDASRLEWLKLDVTSVAYGLRQPRRAAVIGVGGGRDVLTALAFGVESIVGVEINGLLLDLLNGELRDFIGLAGHPGVALIHADGRNFLATHPDRYDLIQMSLVDTAASTAAGAMTLTENGLYTVDAWRLFLDRLEPDGLVSVSRWYARDSPAELSRLVAMASAALLEDGAAAPRQHLAVVSAGDLATLIASRGPLTEADLAALRAACDTYGFDIVILPGRRIADPVLARILAASSAAELAVATQDRVLELEPATDDRPFFFNMLRPRAWLSRVVGQTAAVEGVIGGNTRAAATLLAILAVVIGLVGAGVALPLFMVGRPEGVAPGRFALASSYFSLIGLAFMLLEIGLIERFSLLLGHPAYSLAITLMSIILAAGIGSSLSEWIPVESTWRRVAPLVELCAVILLFLVIIPRVTVTALSWSLPARALVVLAACMPVGLLAGCAFPLGVRTLGRSSPKTTAWIWGLNGGLGVLGSVLAIVVSMGWGISRCIGLAVLLYLLAAGSLALLRPAERS